MTRLDLINKLAKNQPFLSHADVEAAVKAILACMADGLARGERIEIRGFGTFSLHHRPTIYGRNPKTGEKIMINARHVVHFKAGRELKKRVHALLMNKLSVIIIIKNAQPNNGK
jgi:integration host factor subunit beta